MGPPRGPGAGSVGRACPQLCHPAAAGGACGLRRFGPALQERLGPRHLVTVQPFLAVLDRGMPRGGQARPDRSFLPPALACRPLRRAHLPFPGPAGVPGESLHRPLAPPDLSPQRRAPCHLITFCPRTRIPEGSSRGDDRGPHFRRLPWFPTRARAAVGTPSALGRSQRRRAHGPQSELLPPSGGHPRWVDVLVTSVGFPRPLGVGEGEGGFK